MARAYIDGFLGFCINPSVENTAACKGESVRSVVVDDGQFQIAVKWRVRYGLPLHIGIVWRGKLGALIQFIFREVLKSVDWKTRMPGPHGRCGSHEYHFERRIKRIAQSQRGEG